MVHSNYLGADQESCQINYRNLANTKRIPNLTRCHFSLISPVRISVASLSE